jgi:hypothetical protein
VEEEALTNASPSDILVASCISATSWNAGEFASFRRFDVLHRRRSSHPNEGEWTMGKGNNSQKNDKKNKKVKQDKKVVKSPNKK